VILPPKTDSIADGQIQILEISKWAKDKRDKRVGNTRWTTRSADAQHSRAVSSRPRPQRWPRCLPR